LKELQRRDVLDEHFDFDANEKAIVERAKEIAAKEAATQPVVATPEPTDDSDDSDADD